MTTFYTVQVGALETQEYRTTPVPFWLISFSGTIKEPMPDVFRRVAAGWDGCCAESGEAAVVIISALTVPSHDPPRGKYRS
jgi:hypothetical protein